MLNELMLSLPETKSFEAAIMIAESIIASCPQVELEVIHHFSPGIYAREMHIPAGITLTGKIHLTEHLCIVSGDIEIASIDGYQHFIGYHTFVSQPGVKRIGSAYSDTIFTTIHATNCTNIDELEKELAVDTYADYEKYLHDQEQWKIAMSKEYHKFMLEGL